MAWELAAIWLIVTVTIVWFMRDEERLRQRKLAEHARLYATNTAWRHRRRPGVEPIAQRVTAAPGNPIALQTRFLEEMRRR